MRFTLCMPPQQISPSAARRSPKDSATSAASRNVSAIFFVLPAGSLAHSAGLAAESMRMTPYLRMPSRVQLLRDRAGLAHLRDERLALVVAAHGGSAAGRRPHRRDQRADDEIAPADAVGQLLQVVIRRIDADVRIEEEQIDAVELDAVHLRLRGVVEHRVEIDRRLGAGSALADEPGPHRVMDSGIFVHSVDYEFGVARYATRPEARSPRGGGAPRERLGWGPARNADQPSHSPLRLLLLVTSPFASGFPGRSA